MRRLATLATATVVMAVTATGSLGSGASPSAADQRTLPSVAARSADSLVQAYGVGVHLHYLDTPYADTGAVVAALRRLGVRHVRDDLYLDNPQQVAAIRQAAAQGIRFDLITGRPTDGTGPAAYVATIADRLSGAVESIEGTNEWDLSGRPGWVQELRLRQTALYAAAKADPVTARLPVLQPALAFAQNAAALGSLASVGDEANGHFYAGGQMPQVPFDLGIPFLRANGSTGKPLVVTEAGYHNAMRSTGSHLPTPEEVTAAYLPRLLLGSYAGGVKRVYSYELIDEFTDPGLTNAEAHFGLLRHDLSPKPAFRAMRTVLGLTADPGPSFQPGSLAYSLTGAGAGSHQLLLAKRDGTFVLFVWRDVSLWDASARRRLAVAPRTVTLRLDRPASLAAIRPTRGPRPVLRARSRSLSFAVGGEAMAVTIDPSMSGPSGGQSRVPARPRLVRAHPRRGGVVAVHWRAPPGARPTTYRVRCGSRTIDVPARRLRLLVRGLQRRTTVTVGVAAGNAAGWSSFRWTRGVRVR